jgi:hypothetical protein
MFVGLEVPGLRVRIADYAKVDPTVDAIQDCQIKPVFFLQRVAMSGEMWPNYQGVKTCFLAQQRSDGCQHL